MALSRWVCDTCGRECYAPQPPPVCPHGRCGSSAVRYVSGPWGRKGKR